MNAVLRATLLPIALGSLIGCGYQPAYGGSRPEARLTVSAAPARVPRADAVQAVLAGARRRLARAGVLAPGNAYPRMVVEVLRIDEAASGVARAADASGEALPLARGSRVAVLGRAWVVERAGATPSRDTGDMRRIEHHATEIDARLEAERHDDAVRAAGRKLGESLAGRILGEPEPAMEPW